MKFQKFYSLIEKLKTTKNIKVGILGNSSCGLPIYLVHVGCIEGEQIIVEAAIHAREYITTLIALKQIKHLAKTKLNFGIYFVLCVNPDGVALVLDGKKVCFINEAQKQKLVKINKGKDFSLWKANANGVDCNVNFDALWGKEKSNITHVSSANYIGKEPNSEVEVKNLIELTKQVKPVLTLSYHTKGNVIFYGFETLTRKQIKRDLFIAKEISKANKFKPVKTKKSTGGFSDFVSLNYGVPAFTIEFGGDTLTHPITEKHLSELLQGNLTLPIVAYEALKKYNSKHKTWKHFCKR